VGGVFQDRVSLFSPGYSGTHFVDQDSLELRNLPASVSRVLGLRCVPLRPAFLHFSKSPLREVLTCCTLKPKCTGRRVCLCACMCVHACVCAYVGVHTCVHACGYACMCVHVPLQT
jgi:hypothetical protein